MGWTCQDLWDLGDLGMGQIKAKCAQHLKIHTVSKGVPFSLGEEGGADAFGPLSCPPIIVKGFSWLLFLCYDVYYRL